MPFRLSRSVLITVNGRRARVDAVPHECLGAVNELAYTRHRGVGAAFLGEATCIVPAGELQCGVKEHRGLVVVLHGRQAAGAENLHDVTDEEGVAGEQRLHNVVNVEAVH